MKKRICIAALACLATGVVLADGATATRNLLANLAAGGQDIAIRLPDIYVSPTLVRGMYALSTAQGRLVGFTNEAGTLFGAAKGFNAQPRAGASFRPLTREESAGLRREMAAKIDKRQLITVRYGAGKQEFFMFSAIDCPACKAIEDELRSAKSENTTFYVIPSSLQKLSSQRGTQQWRKVAAIWCAPEAGQAWKRYWANGAVPPPNACPVAEPGAAARAHNQLWGMLQGAGVALIGTPSYLRMDGTKFTAESTGTSREVAAPVRWLMDSDAVEPLDFQPRPAAGG